MNASVREDDEGQKLTAEKNHIPCCDRRSYEDLEYQPDVDEGDYDNPVFKIQDEVHEISMETLGFYPSMFY